MLNVFIVYCIYTVYTFCYFCYFAIVAMTTYDSISVYLYGSCGQYTVYDKYFVVGPCAFVLVCVCVWGGGGGGREGGGGGACVRA